MFIGGSDNIHSFIIQFYCTGSLCVHFHFSFRVIYHYYRSRSLTKLLNCKVNKLNWIVPLHYPVHDMQFFNPLFLSYWEEKLFQGIAFTSFKQTTEHMLWSDSCSRRSWYSYKQSLLWMLDVKHVQILVLVFKYQYPILCIDRLWFAFQLW